MKDAGIDVKLGSGVAAAQEYWRKTAPSLAPQAAAPRSPDAQAPAAPLRRPPPCAGSMSHTRYEPAHPRLHRSELAVPGSRPELFEKAAAG